MSIQSILCDEEDPNVFTPAQYSNAFKREPLLTRTPSPIKGIMPMYKEIEYHDSDKSSDDDDDDDDDVEELSRSRPSFSDSITRSSKRRRIDAGPDPNAYSFDLPHDELQMWDFYNHVTCKILSCKNAQGENPWRDDLIIRAQESSALKHSLFAMTSFHMKLYGVDDPFKMADRGIHHTNVAIRSLINKMKEAEEMSTVPTGTAVRKSNEAALDDLHIAV